MSKFDNDGFQIVSSKRTSKNKPAFKIPDINLILQQPDPIKDTDKVIRQIRSAEEELIHSDYFGGFIKSVSTFIQSKKVSEIVCFGLGHIAEWQTSRYQLAFLLSLKDHFNTQKVLSHDPLFYKSECAILNTLDIEVITENKEGHYIISDESITILYLPHCSKQLTHNILWSNWGVNLKNCILICNSFTSLINNQPSRIISETVPLIQKIHPHTTEIPVDNNFKYTDIFNDTSIHIFPEENLAKLDKEFWEKGEKPQYEDSPEFITSLMVEKLNI